MAALRPITIVGGGLAGLTLGIGLRQKGIPVTIWEAGRYPRHRVCGEFISGQGQQVLARLGLFDALRQSGAVSAHKAAFFLDRVASPARTLPSPALCVSRFVLDAFLARRFRALGGELRENQRWGERPFGEGIVRADGRRRHSREHSLPWFGLKVHARNVTLNADLEMHHARSGYVGFCRLGDGEVNICGLFRRAPTAAREAGAPVACQPARPGLSKLAGSRHPGLFTFRNLSGSGTPLGQRLDVAVFDEGSFCSVAGISLRPRRASAWPECCIGDALTMTPPVTGNGMSMAFEAAEMAIAPLAAYGRGGCSWEQARQRVAAVCDRAFAPRLAWGRWLQWMMLTPLLQGWPGLLALRSALLWRVMFAHTR